MLGVASIKRRKDAKRFIKEGEEYRNNQEYTGDTWSNTMDSDPNIDSWHRTKESAIKKAKKDYDIVYDPKGREIR